MANRLLRIALVLGVAAAALEPFVFAGSFAGDAQVHLVFAESASHGRFFEFNPGERVSGETSPGYMLLEAALFRVCPAHLVPLTVKAFNLGTWYFFCFLVYRVARRTLKEPGQGPTDRWAALAALLAALIPGSVYNANVGMENGLFALLIWLWLDLAGRWRWFEPDSELHPARALGLGVVLGVASWIRPEAWLVAAVLLAFQLSVRRSAAKGVVLAAAAMATLGGACIAFQYAFTGDVIATSILSRRILAMKHSVLVGPLTLDATFAKRLALYAPLTVYATLGFLAQPESRAPMLRVLGLMFLTFFVFYTAMGAPQLGRYVIFIVPILAVGAARGVRLAWNWKSTRSRIALAFAAAAIAAIDVAELSARRGIYSQRLLELAMSAPANRRARTDELLHELGNPPRTSVVFAEEPIQDRYGLDERVVIRSLDGRTDRSLLAFVHGGKVDHPAYLLSQHVELLGGPVDYDHGNEPPSLWGIESLPVGSMVRRGDLLFRRLPSRRFAVTVAQSSQDGTGPPL
ncbi:MAG TPA: hypothetical protein VHO67_19715 [Polyangia bacterium]|nr:hypothetical protein [Polyangia bacterium]